MAEKLSSIRPLQSVLLLMLLMTIGFGGNRMVIEARTCMSQSHKFKGPCLSRSNCAGVCKTEGFPGGICWGLCRQCFCTKTC